MRLREPENGYSHRWSRVSSKDPKPYTRGLPRLSPGDQAIQSEMTNAMFKNGVIEYGDSEWSTGVVMAKKKGTTDKRYAVDYRGLNLELLGNYCLRLVPPLGRAYRIYMLEPHFPRLSTISA